MYGKGKVLLGSRLLNPASLNYSIDYLHYQITFKLELTTNLEMFPSKKTEIYKIQHKQFLLHCRFVKWLIFFLTFLALVLEGILSIEYTLHNIKKLLFLSYVVII